MRVRRALAAAAVAAAVAFGVHVRIDLALRIPGFTSPSVEGLLKSDPALLYYFTERIVEAGGRVPPDFGAEPRVEWPLATDVPASFTIGQEFAVAWVHRLLGGSVPIHLVATALMAIAASLAAVGVYGLTRELTGRIAPALFATALYALSPASYRTAGFVLLREDLSLPWLALHAWLFARAVRMRTAPAFAGAGAALGVAAATWHAAPFVAAVEMACVLAWTLRTGRNPLAAPGAWAFVAALAAFGLAVPVLRSHVFLLSLPMQMIWALAALALLGWRRPLGVGARLAAGLGIWLAGLGAALALAHAAGVGLSDYAHVPALLAAKLRFLGELPDDPHQLSFAARLLWQGPFETAAPSELLAGTLAAGVLLFPAAGELVAAWWRGRGDGRAAVLVAFAAACALLAWAMRRNVALLALAAPVAAAVLLARHRLDRRPAWVLGLLAAQALFFASLLEGRQDRWYVPEQRAEIAALIAWMREHLPPDGAVASDFVISPAVLAHTRHPIALQPKYERARSRERIEEFLRAFFFGSPADLQALLGRWKCRYLLVDRETLWGLRYAAGLSLALGVPPPETAAEALLSREPVRFERVQGFRLLYRSPYPSDRLRLYELDSAPDPRSRR